MELYHWSQFSPDIRKDQGEEQESEEGDVVVLRGLCRGKLDLSIGHDGTLEVLVPGLLGVIKTTGQGVIHGTFWEFGTIGV